MARDIPENLADYDYEDFDPAYEDEVYEDSLDRRQSVDIRDEGETPAAKLPYRAIAMVLIAVALMLGLWGIYVSTQGDKDEAVDTKVANAPQQPGAEAGKSGQQAGQQAGQQPGQQPGEAAKPAQQPGQQPKPAGDPAQAGQEKPATDPAKKPGQTGNKGITKVNVLNNGAIPGLAQSTVNLLNQQGMKAELGSPVAGSQPGNLAHIWLERNTVFFDPNTPGAEQRARELADQVGGIARANDGTVGAANQDPNALTLVVRDQF